MQESICLRIISDLRFLSSLIAKANQDLAGFCNVISLMKISLFYCKQG